MSTSERRVTPTQKEVAEAQQRISARRKAGIEPSTNHLYDIERLRAGIDAEDRNISAFEGEIDKANARKRDLRRLLAKQEDIQARLARGEYVEGYSPKPTEE